jgi:hypothetical protein
VNLPTASPAIFHATSNAPSSRGLTDTLEAAFGTRPTVYRAGRYGVGPNTAELLQELGYEIDVSVRSLLRLSRRGRARFHPHEAAPLPRRAA